MIKDLSNEYSKFKEEGVEVVVISPQKEIHVKKFQEKHDPKIILVADESREVTKQFMVFTRGSIMDFLEWRHNLGIKTSYLLDPEGRIVWRYVGKNSSDNPPIPLLFQAIQEN
ncbi:MAG: peroxiredoxin family protein, partial [Planctomycetota bacterium]